MGKFLKKALLKFYIFLMSLIIFSYIAPLLQLCKTKNNSKTAKYSLA